MDPLKPFGTLVRAVWSKSVRRTERAERNAAGTATTAVSLTATQAVQAPQPLHGRLRQRMAGMSEWDKDQARRLFVEAVLLDEFGEELQRDPAFVDMVRKLSVQIGSDIDMSSRLDVLLKQFKNGESSE